MIITAGPPTLVAVAVVAVELLVKVAEVMAINLPNPSGTHVTSYFNNQ
jgi:hypothetical protein